MTEPAPVAASSTITASVDAVPQSRDVELETENLIATYDSVAEWIRFADAKAAVVLTVNGALAGTLIPTLKEGLGTPGQYGPIQYVAAGLFLVWLVLLLVSSLFAFRCILPYRRKGTHPSLERCSHFHPAAISNRYGMDDVDAFVSGYRSTGEAGFQKEVLAGLLIDSHISASKYGMVTRSIRMLGWSALAGMLYLLGTQLI